MPGQPLKIGMVAGESSGDQLAAALLQALDEKNVAWSAEGIAGERMRAAGCRVLESSDRLSIIGFVEVLRRYWELRALRRRIIEHFLSHPPDIFVGIDAPEFNLEVEERLRSRGVRTIHYVSPTVWAWRPGRLDKIARAVDLMLTLFPFEANYYKEHRVPVQFVGHPKAEEIPLEVDALAARSALQLDPDATLVALLPGSRPSEWRYLVEPFLRTAQWCRRRRGDLQFLAPLVGARGKRWFEAAERRIAPELKVRTFEGRSQEVMAAADVVLAASGTASLEAMLLKRPMVVAYRLAWLNYAVLRRLVDVAHFSLPNLLAGETLVPEFLQSEVRPEPMGKELLRWLDDAAAVQALKERFTDIHHTLRRGGSTQAAAALLELAAS